MLRQTLTQKLQQKLSPAQIQVIKMLEIPTLEMEERIRQELEENPALEEGRELDEDEKTTEENDLNDDGGNNDDMDLDEYMQDDDIPDYKLRVNNTSKDDKREEIPFSIGKTFHDYLREQLGWQKLTEHERLIGEYVIGNIEDDGYLSRSVESMTDDILFYAGLETNEEELAKIVSIVQSFDPPGIAAMDLQECLKLQLERKEPNHIIEIATKIIKERFEEFSKKHYDKIQKALDIDEELLKEAIAEIVRLNPKPGNAWGGDVIERTMGIVVPDFVLERDEDALIVHLNNSNIPDIRVNRTYNELFKTYQESKKLDKQLKDAVIFAKQKVDAARWFIDAIKQRQETLLTTMQAIVDYQYEFFLEGDEMFLKPMILKDIAEITGYDISTISRVSNSKYVQTEFGVYPIKYFFSESMTTASGEEVSTREIKKILQECIDNEDKSKPLNDEALAALLKTKGYNIARRTIAKYREQLNIPVSRLRKEL